MTETTRFLADENLNADIVRGVLRRRPSTDIVFAQDKGLGGEADPGVLEWAACVRRATLD